MDREQARFILKSIRADGSDASDADFAEALAVAASDRELGEWLGRERARDAAFAAALGRVDLPPELREEVLACFDVHAAIEFDEADHALASGLGSIRPPAGLRQEILIAMEKSEPAEVVRPSRWKYLAIPLAAAAGIVLAMVLSKPGETSSTVPIAGVVPANSGTAVPISHVENSAISTLESPGFTLDLSNPDHEVLFNFIRNSGRACPGGCVPKGLEDIPGIGCRTLDVDGKEGAIVCFRRGEGDAVHLVVFREADVKASLPTCGHPKLGKHGDWTVARWQQDGRVFLLLGHLPEEQLDQLF
ncbi:hypothetical protein [Haloferula sargassicola]|uniref:Anti-sigma factor n=1 Tax=Haloferula sargassicola TaxID=490096 RepID=A0ABP9UJW4_9BACT